MAPAPNQEGTRLQSDLPVYRISRVMESFNRKAKGLRNTLGSDGGFQFVQRAWARKDEDSEDEKQFKTLSELRQESPNEFWERCRSSTGYFLFTYFRNESDPQSSPLGDTSSLLCKWIRKSLRQGGIWHTFLNLVEWPNDIARNARDEVKRRARDERELYHDLLQLFVRLPIRGYIPEVVHRAWWRHRRIKKREGAKPRGARNAVPDVSFLTRNVSGAPQTLLPSLSVKRVLPDGIDNVANFGKEVLPKRHRDTWARDEILPQPGPDPRRLFGENDERKARQVQLLYSTVLDPLYRGELDEEELRGLLEKAIGAENPSQMLEEQAEEELEELCYLWIPLLERYSVGGGHGSLLGWLFAELSLEGMNPQGLYSRDHRPNLQLLLDQLSGQIRRVSLLEAERQALSQDEEAHQALANRVHYLGDFKIRDPAGAEEADLRLSQSELDVRLTPTTNSRPPNRTYAIHYGPDVLPHPARHETYEEDLNGEFRSLYRSLRRIKRAEESGKMRFQRAMASTYSHSYMKTATTIRREVDNLPEGENLATKNEIISHFSLGKVKEVYSSEGIHEAKSKIKSIISKFYKLVGNRRDFSDIKFSYRYLYKRLSHLDNLLTSNISDLQIYPGSGSRRSDMLNVKEEVNDVLKKIKENEADLGYGKISEGMRYLNTENIEFEGQNDIYIRRPNFGPDRKVKDEEKLTKLFEEILREGVWRELIVNILSNAFAVGKPDPSEAWIALRYDDNTLLIENWADNDDVGDGREQKPIREPHGNQGFGLYGVRMTATEILQIANTVRYFERPNQSCVEISMRQGWVVDGSA